MTTRREFLTVGMAMGATAAVGRPIRGIIGADNVEYTEEESGWDRSTAKYYVQDGLIGMWDGIENIGWGKHSSGTTVWHELIGGGFGSIPISAPNADSVQFQNVLYKKDIEFQMPGTVEMFCRNVVYNPFFNIGSPASYSALLSSGGYLTYSPYNQTYEFWAKDRVLKIAKTDAAYPITFIYANGEVSLYQQGRYRTKTIDRNTTQTWSSFSIGNYNKMGFTGESCFIRLYDRILTSDEIAYNYAIDQERFDLA